MAVGHAGDRPPEDPHPGAQFSFTDIEGHRFQCFMCDSIDDDIAFLEARHRSHARVEDRIRAAKDLGLRNLPFCDFAANAAWVEVVLMAQDLLAWTRRLCLPGELAKAEPKRLRYALWHTAGPARAPRPHHDAAPVTDLAVGAGADLGVPAAARSADPGLSPLASCRNFPRPAPGGCAVCRRAR